MVEWSLAFFRSIAKAKEGWRRLGFEGVEINLALAIFTQPKLNTGFSGDSSFTQCLAKQQANSGDKLCRGFSCSEQIHIPIYTIRNTAHRFLRQHAQLCPRDITINHNYTAPHLSSMTTRRSHNFYIDKIVQNLQFTPKARHPREYQSNSH